MNQELVKSGKVVDGPIQDGNDGGAVILKVNVMIALFAAGIDDSPQKRCVKSSRGKVARTFSDSFGNPETSGIALTLPVQKRRRRDMFIAW